MVRDLGCYSVKRKCGYQTNNGIRNPAADCYEIMITQWSQFGKPVDAPANLIDNAFISQRIEHITRYAIGYRFIHSELTAMKTKNFFWMLLYTIRQNDTNLLSCGNIMSDRTS